MDIILYILYYVIIVISTSYIIYLSFKINKLLKELDKQIKLSKKIAEENIALEIELRNIKEEHLKEIQAVNEVVRKQEEYVYDLEQKLKTRKAQTKITVNKNEITTEIKSETEKPKKTRKPRKKGENK